jgi:hypothetical protein
MAATTFLILAMAAKVSSASMFEIRSQPINLRPGEVHNTIVKPIPLPQDIKSRFHNSSMPIVNYTMEVFSVDKNGVETKAPLYHVYNHHYIFYMGSQSLMDNLYNFLVDKDPLSGQTCNKSNHTFDSLKSMHPIHSDIQFLLEANGGASNDGAVKENPYLGGATGGEYRENPHSYPAPYAYRIVNPEAFAPVIHLINTRGSTTHDKPLNASAPPAPAGGFSPLIECPCPPQRKFDYAKGTIDGCQPDIPFSCNDALIAQNNTGCSLETYTGGYRCCKHRWFVSDTTSTDVRTLPIDTFVLRFRFWYEDDLESAKNSAVAGTGKRTRQLQGIVCCDVTSDLELTRHQVEYDVPVKANTNPQEKECQHIATNVQMLDWAKGDPGDPTETIELVYASGHMHAGGLRLEMVDDDTGELLCEVHAASGVAGGGDGSGGLRYGNSSAAGDEAGFLVASRPCVWGPPPLLPPPILQRNHKIRTVAYYNCSVEHHGVMALWLAGGAGDV